MASFESFEEQIKIDEETEKIKHLIESGEAYDKEDAKDALFFEEEANFFRELDKEEFLKEIDKKLKKPEESPDDNERYNLRFERAVISIAESADEREFLYYVYWLSLAIAISEDDAINKRRESSRRRLGERKNALSSKISDERLNKILSEYKAEELPELLFM